MRNVISILAAAMLLLAAGCTPQESEFPSPEPTAVPTSFATTVAVPSPSPTPSPSPVQSFPPVPEGEDAEITAIRKGWEAYELAVDALRKHPLKTEYTELQNVTTEVETSAVIGEIARLRELGWRRDGDVVHRSVSVGPATVAADGSRNAEVSYCVDPSYARTVSIETGETIRESSETMQATVTMELGPDGVWRASDYRSEFAPC